MKIAAVILIWAIAFIGRKIMKKLEPQNRAYSVYLLTICIIFTLLQLL